MKNIQKPAAKTSQAKATFFSKSETPRTIKDALKLVLNLFLNFFG